MRSYQTLDPDGPISRDLLYDRYDDQAEQMLDRLIPVYLEYAPSTLDTICAAHAAGDLDALWKAAHRMFSTSASICVPQLERMLKMIERAGRSGDAAQVDLLLPALVFQHNQLITYLAAPQP